MMESAQGQCSRASRFGIVQGLGVVVPGGHRRKNPLVSADNPGLERDDKPEKYGISGLHPHDFGQ